MYYQPYILPLFQLEHKKMKQRIAKYHCIDHQDKVAKIYTLLPIFGATTPSRGEK
jgi:hypothetical protein